jgi:hypothetical protein
MAEAPPYFKPLPIPPVRTRTKKRRLLFLFRSLLLLCLQQHPTPSAQRAQRPGSAQCPVPSAHQQQP